MRLGSSVASDLVALSSLVLAELEKIRALYNTHTHVSAAPASPTSTPAVPMPPIGNVAATKVRAE